jgi:sulfate adenylyltransferase
VSHDLVHPSPTMFTSQAEQPNIEAGAPHGGVLTDLLVDAGRVRELKQRSVAWPSWQLARRQLCDLELLACGGFSPLTSFLGRDDYSSVCQTMRLANGTLWPMPVMLDLPADTVAEADSAGALALRDPEGTMLAVLHITDAWRPDLRAEALAVFGTVDCDHPGVAHLLRDTNPWYVTGALEAVQLPDHHDFEHLRHTPEQVREAFAGRGWSRVVAFQTRNPMHRAHQELTIRAAAEAEARLLIHPVVGVTKPGDVDVYTRVRCYQALLPSYPAGTAMLSLLPLAMRMAGPREAMWHAIIRKNYGASHFIVGRDHAGPGIDSAGEPFYQPYEAQELLAGHSDELGIEVVPFRQMVYVEGDRAYVPIEEVPPGAQLAHISGTEVRRHLTEGLELPSWFTSPAVAAELMRSHPPRSHQGFTLFFTGLSGSGKSTIANVLVAKLRERVARHVTLLDGDVIRRHLSAELGFSPEHRELNVLRAGFVAAEITKHRGIAICALIAPYDAARRQVQQMVESHGGFVLVHVATPLAVCEDRDRKGLYAKARAGLLPRFTGLSDPFEEPTAADLVIDTGASTPEQAADELIALLEDRGYLVPENRGSAVASIPTNGTAAS